MASKSQAKVREKKGAADVQAAGPSKADKTGNIDSSDEDEDEEYRRHMLMNYWPMSDGTDAVDMTGSDCAAVVIRYICSQTYKVMDGLHDDFDNAFVEYVLKMQPSFSAAEEQKRRAFMAPRLWRKVNKSNVAGELGVLSFQQIMESEFFTKSFWPRPEFTSPMLLAPEAGDPDVDWKNTKIRMLNMLEWDPAKTGSPHDAVVMAYGFVPDADLNIGPMAWSKVLQIKFNPTREKSPGLKFSGITRFTLPVLAVEYANVKGVVNHEYTLIAVVRLRDPSKEEADYVRLYNRNCNNFLPKGDRHDNAAYINDDWSVEEQDRSYMLYYLRISPTKLPARSGVEVKRQ